MSADCLSGRLGESLNARTELGSADGRASLRDVASKTCTFRSRSCVAVSELEMSTNLAQPEDSILLSGPTGEHGISIPAQRECLEFEKAVGSDSAALYTLVAGMLKVTRAIRCMCDPERGGLSSAL